MYVEQCIWMPSWQNIFDEITWKYIIVFGICLSLYVCKCFFYTSATKSNERYVVSLLFAAIEFLKYIESNLRKLGEQIFCIYLYTNFVCEWLVQIICVSCHIWKKWQMMKITTDALNLHQMHSSDDVSEGRKLKMSPTKIVSQLWQAACQISRP